MFAPERSHRAYAYLQAGLRVIPCERGQKTPSYALPGRQWKRYQAQAPSEDEVDGWLASDPDCNWGLICGDGLFNADADDVPLAQWLLANPQHPVLRGAALHRSGRGKAHLFFRTAGPTRSTVWRLLPGRKAGDLRGDGEYVLVPPSRLDGGGAYELVSGSLRALPLISDPEAYLAQITSTFLDENPDQKGAPPDLSNKRVLSLSDEQKAAAVSRVSRLGLKKKILDTLLIPGNQDPFTKHWMDLADPSHSAIDFHVVCELVRKDWGFDEIEEVFAACLVGDACYRNLGRANHGQGYLLATFNNAKRDVDAERTAARQARGDNFVVTRAVRTQTENEAYYHLDIQTTHTPPRRGQIDLSSDELLDQRAVIRACFRPPLHFTPTFLRAHQGKDFILFSAAVEGMVSETTRGPEGSGRLGYLAALARQFIRSRLYVVSADPQTPEDIRALGWRSGETTYHLRLIELYKGIRPQERNLQPREALDALARLGAYHTEHHRWPNGDLEEFIVLDMLPPGSGPRLVGPSS